MQTRHVPAAARGALSSAAAAQVVPHVEVLLRVADCLTGGGRDAENLVRLTVLRATAARTRSRRPGRGHGY